MKVIGTKEVRVELALKKTTRPARVQYFSEMFRIKALTVFITRVMPIIQAREIEPQSGQSQSHRPDGLLCCGQRTKTFATAKKR
jgi:hypothetical protein